MFLNHSEKMSLNFIKNSAISFLFSSFLPLKVNSIRLHDKRTLDPKLDPVVQENDLVKINASLRPEDPRWVDHFAEVDPRWVEKDEAGFLGDDEDGPVASFGDNLQWLESLTYIGVENSILNADSKRIEIPVQNQLIREERHRGPEGAKRTANAFLARKDNCFDNKEGRGNRSQIEVANPNVHANLDKLFRELNLIRTITSFLGSNTKEAENLQHARWTKPYRASPVGPSKRRRPNMEWVSDKAVFGRDSANHQGPLAKSKMPARAFKNFARVFGGIFKPRRNAIVGPVREGQKFVTAAAKNDLLKHSRLEREAEPQRKRMV